ncbi:MAG: acetoacetate--CoA ligase [Legionellaceae bacterium]|nr:acetoacetate--CoA ligase [Legionellaceae bacterium]
MNHPVWIQKNSEIMNKTQMMRFLRQIEKKYACTLPDYAALHAWSIQHTAQFWEEIAHFFNISFETPPEHIFKPGQHMMDATWFEGATLNITQHLLRLNNNHMALICINEQGQRETLSYHALAEQVAACAAGLQTQGIKAGDRVAAMLPNSSFAIIAMLATASLGAIWSSCSPDFGIAAAVDRLSQITPKLFLIANGYQYHGKTYDLQNKAEAIRTAVPSIEQLIVCPVHPNPMQTPWPNSLNWDALLCPGAPLPNQAFAFHHPWMILFSSGTTGKPKCITHSTGGTLLQHVKELGLHTDLNTDDTLFFHTTCGWMMWNWMVSGLALGATLVLYDGSPMYPTPERMFDIIDNEAVTVFGTGARFLAAIEKNGTHPNTTHNFAQLRTILSTGSPLLPQQYDFVRDDIKHDVQLSSISGGTDIVSCFALGNPISPVYPGEIQCLGLGMDVQIFNQKGNAVNNTTGELVCTQAFPSMPLGFWNDPDRINYTHAYFEQFPGVWAHGDMAKITSHGGLVIYGRSDAVLNPGGVRIGTAEIYRPLDQIPEILESIVIGQTWKDDVRIILFVKLREHSLLDEALTLKIKQTIRSEASPRHVPAKIIAVPDIPRTISGKIVEIAVRQCVNGEAVENTGSLANPEALEYFKNRQELMCG